MALSSSQRVKNDVSSQETTSDKYIPQDCYYVVRIELRVNSDAPKSGDLDFIDYERSLEKFVKKFLKTGHPSDPLLGYVFGHVCYLFFSSTDQERYLGGSQQRICSEFTSIFCMEFGIQVEVRVVEIESRTRSIIYFQTKIHENEKTRVKLLSKGSLKQKEIDSLTLSELTAKLKSVSDVDWNKVEPSVKYGTFYKYSPSTKKFIGMSERINMLNEPKYSSYFFS